MLDCIGQICSQDPKVRVKDVKRVLNVCVRNTDHKEVLESANQYLSTEYNKHDINELKEEVSVFDLIESFGAMNIDVSIFKNLSQVVDKVATEKDIEKAIKNINSNKDLETSFWVLSHLISNEKVNRLIGNGEFSDVEKKISSFINDEHVFSERFSETVGFLYYYNQQFPENSRSLIDRNKVFWKRLIEKMDEKTGNKRELGLLLIGDFLELYEDTLLN